MTPRGCSWQVGRPSRRLRVAALKKFEGDAKRVFELATEYTRLVPSATWIVRRRSSRSTPPTRQRKKAEAAISPRAQGRRDDPRSWRYVQQGRAVRWRTANAQTARSLRTSNSKRISGQPWDFKG